MTSPSRPWSKNLERRARLLRVSGRSYAAIGEKLGVSVDTVRYHLVPSEAERRNRNSRARYARLAAAQGPKVPRRPLPPARVLSLRLRGPVLDRLERLAASRGLGTSTVARQLLVEILEGGGMGELT